MNRSKQVAAFSTLVAVFAGPAASSCTGPDRLRTGEAPGQTLIVLLPDASSGEVGRATVTNASGAVELSGARDTTSANGKGPPTPATVMSEAEVKRIFGAALSAMPPAPIRFTLFFRFESDEPTAESRALVPKVIEAVKGRPAPEVAVVGHTDTSGPAATNLELGLRRAAMVRDLLIAGGLTPAFIELSSHGESELLVPTADDVFEPRNRRVEISVR